MYHSTQSFLFIKNKIIIPRIPGDYYLNIFHYDGEHFIRDKYLFYEDFSFQPFCNLWRFMCECGNLILSHSIHTCDRSSKFSIHLYCNRNLIIYEHKFIIFWPFCKIHGLSMSHTFPELFCHMWSKWMKENSKYFLPFLLKLAILW